MSQRFCTQCGAELPEEGNFCSQCGAQVEGVTASPASPAPAQPATTLSPPPAAQPAMQAQPSAKQSGMSRTVLYGLGGVAVVAALLAVVYFGFLRSDSVESDCGDEPCIVDLSGAGGQSAPASATVAPDIPNPEVARIPVDEAYAHFEDGTAIFVDVRDRDSYTTRHIVGAVWMPEADVSARYAELPKDALIFTYCT